uniref:Fibronectin type-III domain-containing protein n=1 Tax=Macrostomum lignano TaxID=282301 RepID=A0A1I8FPI3_9PLAT
MSPPSEVRCQAEGEDRCEGHMDGAASEEPQRVGLLRTSCSTCRLLTWLRRRILRVEVELAAATASRDLGPQPVHKLLSLSVGLKLERSLAAVPPSVLLSDPFFGAIPPADIRAFGANSSAVALAWRQTDRPNGELLRYDLQARCDGGLSGAGKLQQVDAGSSATQNHGADQWDPSRCTLPISGARRQHAAHWRLRALGFVHLYRRDS